MRATKPALVLALSLGLPVAEAGIVVTRDGQAWVGDVTEHPDHLEVAPGVEGLGEVHTPSTIDVVAPVEVPKDEVRWWSAVGFEPTDAYWETFADAPLRGTWEASRARWEARRAGEPIARGCLPSGGALSKLPLVTQPFEVRVPEGWWVQRAHDRVLLSGPRVGLEGVRPRIVVFACVGSEDDSASVLETLHDELRAQCATYSVLDDGVWASGTAWSQVELEGGDGWLLHGPRTRVLRALVTEPSCWVAGFAYCHARDAAALEPLFTEVLRSVRVPEQAQPPLRHVVERALAEEAQQLSLPEAPVQLDLDPFQPPEVTEAHREALAALQERLPEVIEAFEAVRRETLERTFRLELWDPAVHAGALDGDDRAPEEARRDERLLNALGFAQPGGENFAHPGASAFYDAERDAVVLLPEVFQHYLRGGQSPQLGPWFAVDGVLVHELTHVLQHQRFPEFPRTPRAEALPPESLVGRWLIEGEASLVGLLYTCAAYEAAGIRYAGREPFVPEHFMVPHAHELWWQLERLEANAARFREVPGVLEDQRQQLDAARAYLSQRAVLFGHYLNTDPYGCGKWLPYEAWSAGGWEAVDALLQDPPCSSEQFLHAPDGDAPRALRPGSPEGWTSLGGGVVGERLLQILFESTLGDPQLEACAGWGGDWLETFRDQDGREVWVWRLVWDREDDAEEFAEAFGASHHRLVGELRNGWVQRDGARVLITCGLNRERAAELLAEPWE